ncbi:MAG: type VI secretion system-associated FHA domain protein TagH [Gammaproteobacteria bacterium]|jgi:type VI secretion system protein|nr:type VI secretion system-associated FHA domain protein TagH [Gammaproteobacteria bacterium]
MPLIIKLVSEHRDLVGDDCVREYHESGGTIGRSLRNDWILPDPDRYISSRHATIDHKGGMYYLADMSSNGVYMNDEVEPIGKGNPRRLFDGDRMRMGDFEFEISIDKGESLVMPLDEEPSVAPDNIEQFVDEDVLETGMQLLSEDEITGDDEFQSVLFGNKSKEPEPEPEPETVDEPANDDSAANKSVGVSAEDLFDSFLDGLGISRVELHPSLNRPEMMLTAGLVLREFVEGTIKLLGSRANLKNAFRLDQTTVLPRHNNPMKFSDNTNDLIKQLLIGGEGEYLGARDAVREANRDLLNHQSAFLDAMNSAFIEFADRFDPDELQDGFDRTINSKLFSFRNKSKYWGLYRELYPIMTEKGGGRFPQMFGEEFVKAYERQVAEYQRHDREGTAEPAKASAADQAIDPGLMETQKIDGPVITESIGSDQPFDEDSIVEAVSLTDADDADQSFIDELENSLEEEINRDQLKA